MNRKDSHITEIKNSYYNHLKYTLSVNPEQADNNDRYLGLAYALRDRITDKWFETRSYDDGSNGKKLNYFSFEYLMGRAFQNNIINMGIEEEIGEVLSSLGIHWDELKGAMKDAGLGNGGLGRLAACFLDSLATLDYPAYGYGLRYKYGFFKQIIKNGYQVEVADDWLRDGFPWEIKRYDKSVTVKMGGKVLRSKSGKAHWVGTSDVSGVPYDIPIVGYGINRVNTLRLWDARSIEAFDFQHFNQGNYDSSIDARVKAETLTMVLYPNDEIIKGAELRFKQQYFFVSCSLQDIFRRFEESQNTPSYSTLPDFMAIQLNDTHPAIAVAELMRILIDEKEVLWDEAWDITVKTLGYTNHTLMPEALETWSVKLFEMILPRHLDIIYEINHRFMTKVSQTYPGDIGKMERMSLIHEMGGKRVRMAHLAILGSHSVNGVAELHSELIKKHLVPDFYGMFPQKFNNKTNGITQRRWLRVANPPLAKLITSAIGDKWITHLDEISHLKKYGQDGGFLEELERVKRLGKEALVSHCERQYGMRMSVETLFDVQVKRIHEYKRQLLNLLHVITLYIQIKNGRDIHPRTVIFSGKAAPGYHKAKLIIKLINNVASVINRDTKVSPRLQVFFLPNYSVSLAEKIFPASDISEQISTAGTEASGTGNMKFILNGALTMGTLDGANIEILEEVGKENMFVFGLTSQEAFERRKDYDPKSIYFTNPVLREVIDLISSNHFSKEEPDLFEPILEDLLNHDHFLHLADYDSYLEAHQRAERLYGEREEWLKASLSNIAGSGKFSSDRTIQEYARDIWNLRPCPVEG